jgi:hypothetical protein
MRSDGETRRESAGMDRMDSRARAGFLFTQVPGTGKTAVRS